MIILAIVLGVASFFISQPGARGQAEKEAPPGNAVEKEDGDTFAAARLIVTYEEGTPEAAEEVTVEEVQGEVQDEIAPLNAEVVALPEVAKEKPGKVRKNALRRAKEKLEGDPDVAAVDYDRLRRASYTPNDPGFANQWGLKLPGFPAAWDREDGDGSALAPGAAKIAIVDQGISAGHPDLKGKVLAQWDFVNGDAVAKDGTDGHGTHVAGVAAATTRNSRGIAGGCPDCKLLAAKVLDANGSGTSSNIAKGIVWAANNGAKVINLSFGGAGSVKVENDAVDYAIRKGAVVVGAAGNAAQYGNEPDYPAAYGPVVAVAATDRYDRRASFSNYGSYVDIAAPGVSVYSTVLGRSYGYMNGTSQASPHVAALAGLLAAQGRTRTEINSRIFSTAKDLGTAGRDPYYGVGRINASAAVR